MLAVARTNPATANRRKSQAEIAAEQGFGGGSVRTAVADRTGKSINGLTGRRSQAPADPPGRLASRSIRIRNRAGGRSLRDGPPLPHLQDRKKGENDMTTETLVYTPWGWTRDIEKVDEGVW